MLLVLETQAQKYDLAESSIFLTSNDFATEPDDEVESVGSCEADNKTQTQVDL